MNFPSVFEASTTDHILSRLDQLTAETKPLWGKMTAAQMLAHLNVNYDITYGNVEVKYNAFMRFMLKLFLKKTVVGDKPYKKNSQTAPVFEIKGDRDFDKEKARFVDFVKTTQTKKSFFEGKVSGAFGALSTKEWSTQFYKHLDHHFNQFGL